MDEKVRPLLCIVPGWGGTRETWRDFIASAEECFDVQCIELPCFGGVPCPSTPWGVDQYAEYVFHQLMPIKKENPRAKIILLGHSFGGQVSTRVAVLHPDSFDELVLIAPAIVRPKRKIKRAVFGFFAKIGKSVLHTDTKNTTISEMKRKMYSAIFSPDYADTTGIERDIFRKVIREDLREYLPQIKKQALIFWGKHDSYTPLRHGKEIKSIMNTNAELIVFPEGRHGLHHSHSEDIIKTLQEKYCVTDS